MHRPTADADRTRAVAGPDKVDTKPGPCDNGWIRPLSRLPPKPLGDAPPAPPAAIEETAMSSERHAMTAAYPAGRRALGPEAPSLQVPAKPAPRPRGAPRRWWWRFAAALQPAAALRPAH